MTDHSFFDDFFNDEPERKCCRCGAKENLIVVSNDSQTYICEDCQEEKRNKTYTKTIYDHHGDRM